MKKKILIGVATALLLSGCVSQQNIDESKISKLQTEISSLEKQKESLEQYIVDLKEDNNVEKYVVTLEIKQSHFTLDIGEHVKDSMNKIEIQVPVDKEYYDNVQEGGVINDEFRYGSWLMKGSFGKWKVKVVKKEIIK